MGDGKKESRRNGREVRFVWDWAWLKQGICVAWAHHGIGSVSGKSMYNKGSESSRGWVSLYIFTNMCASMNDIHKL